jgi:hypothetical protein
MTAALLVSAPAFAQWLKFPTPGVPRLPDGKPNLAAPAPKANGKPDFSGTWEPRPGYTGNIARDLKEGVPFQPWAEKVYKERQETLGKDDPQAYCVLSGVPREHVVPYPFKIFNTTSNGTIVIIYEALHSYRQIFMDGRELPKNPNPTWMGYSVGHWEGDTLVVESSGFVENNWLDNGGHMGTEALKLTERFRRPDWGHMEVEVTVDDPKAYTKPWTVKLAFTAAPDTELIEYVCDENEKDVPHLVGK